MPMSGRRTGISAASSMRAMLCERLRGHLPQALAGHERQGARLRARVASAMRTMSRR